MRVVVGCVADNSQKYLDQALRLVKSWRWFAGKFADCEFHVCVVGAFPAEYLEKYESYGARVHMVSRFSDLHPPSNKLRFLELPNLVNADRVVLLDCDMVIVQEPRELICEANFAAKIADFPTVTPDIFRTLFSAYELPLPEATERCTVHGESIIPYFNAGVLSFSQNAMVTLIPEWIRINRNLVRRLDLLGQCSNFCEQASLSIALASCGTSFETLGNSLNFPAHCQDESLSSDFYGTDPVIIHYHWLVDESGLLQPSPYPNVNARIEQFNERLLKEKRRNFDKYAFNFDRHQQNLRQGSVLGSNELLAGYKRGLLEHVVAACQPASILDIGCGDVVVGEVLPELGYAGIDMSATIIEANSAKFPSRKFICGDFANRESDGCDLIVCFEKLIYIKDKSYYRKFVEQCVEAAILTGVIAAYEEAPEWTSDDTFFHEPLSKTLTIAGAINIREIGAYNQVSVFQFDKHSRVKLANDPLADSRLKQPIFLVGAMRSGTTLLADLLGRSSYIAHCPFELKDVWSAVGKIPMASPKTHDLVCPECKTDDASLEMKSRLSEAFLMRMSDLQVKNTKAVFLNKNPHLCNKLPLVKSLFPDSRFIWIQRPLPQVVASIKRLFTDVHKRQSTWHWWPLPSEHVRNRCWNAIYSESQLSDIPSQRTFPGGNIRYLAEYWLESNRAVSEFFSMLKPEDWSMVSELNLLMSPASELAYLQGFLAIPFCIEACQCEGLDISRNDHWRDLLSFREIDELIQFVEARSDEINKISKDASPLYQQLIAQQGVLRESQSGRFE